jgi:Kef-type K+ transport system membrane component KefB
MTTAEIGSLALALMLLIGTANLVGLLFLRARQPKIIGEIAGGILLGPMLLGKLFPAMGEWFGAAGSGTADVLLFLYNLGLLLLMFISGSAAHRILAAENRRATAWLLICGTTLPFVFAFGLATTTLQAPGPTELPRQALRSPSSLCSIP